MGSARCTGPAGSDARPGHPRCGDPGLDVRDLAGWLLRNAENGAIGTHDAVGPVVPFSEWLALSRAAGGHTGPVAHAPAGWLLEQGVEQFMGEDSLAMWSVDEDQAGWSSRPGAAAQAAGLQHRPREALLRDVLVWERGQGLDRPRAAGLSATRERELLTALSSAG